MKNLKLSAIAVLLLAGSSMAADRNETVQTVAEANTGLHLKSSTPAASYSALMEENLNLRLKAEALDNKVYDLQNRLDYTQMMHSTIINLQDAISTRTTDEVKLQLDFARMMHVTILNLKNLQVGEK